MVKKVKGRAGQLYGEPIVVVDTRPENRVLVRYEDGFEEIVTQDNPDLEIYNYKPKVEQKPEFDTVAFGSPARVAFIAAMGCCICNRRPAHNAHVVSRGAGGTYKDIVPLCAKHHAEQHQVGLKTFQTVYRKDLTALARDISRVVDDFAQIG